MRTRIKVCGITAPEDAVLAASAGADFVGVVMTESPRRVTQERAREIAGALPPEALLVAVFAQETAETVARAIDGLPVHAVQVAGWSEVREGLPCDVWHVLRAATLPDPATLPLAPLRTYLLDAHDARRPGGTGLRADWDWARRAVNVGVRLFVAGGLSPENVDALVREVRPFGVDASSELELAIGRKDPAKLRAFVARIREADRVRPRLS
jgi:phosphoribosylanthranilate isomerase